MFHGKTESQDGQVRVGRDPGGKIKLRQFTKSVLQEIKTSHLSS